MNLSPSAQDAIVADIEALCRQVQRRVRLQRACAMMTRYGAYALATVALVVGLNRLRWVELADELPWLLMAALISLSAFVVGWSRPVSTLEAARLLDKAGALFDRLGSAWAFSTLKERSGHHEAAIYDAGRFVSEANPKAAAPIRLPKSALPFASSLLMLVMVSFLVIPVGGIEAAMLEGLHLPAERVRVKAMVSEADRAQLAAEQVALEAERAQTKDPRVAAWIGELNALLRALHEGRLTPTQAHSALAKLERAKEALDTAIGEDAEAMAEHAKQAAKKTKSRRGRQLSETLEALREKHWREAAASMERLAERLDSGKMSRREKKRLGQDMAALAKRLETERQRERDRLQKSRDRLKKKEQKRKDRFSKRDRDRLKRQERKLDRLERERRQAGEMRRQLERLQRGLDAAAQDLLKRMKEGQSQLSASELRQAAEMLRRMSQSEQGRRQMRAASGRMIDLKELLRRAQRGQGKGGKEGGKGSALERFLVRAKGDKGSSGSGAGKSAEDGEKTLALGQKGGGSIDLVMPGLGGAPMGGAPGGGGGQGEQGEGVGQGHDPKLLAGATESEVTTFDAQVSGRHGEGDSKSRVVFSAAKKGFASKGWGRVHQDYSEVVEKALDEQSIPAGKRRYVRRYFDLIRPR